MRAEEVATEIVDALDNRVDDASGGFWSAYNLGSTVRITFDEDDKSYTFELSVRKVGV